MSASTADGRPVLALDTATTRAVVALGAGDGEVRAEASWVAGYRHGEELLARIEALLRDAGVGPGDLGGLIAGTGPGAFTGLRVGLATVKGLCHALGIPLVGVPTSDALLRAAGGGPALLLLPAGPNDRVACRAGEPARIVPGDVEPERRPGERLLAVDLAGRAPDEAVEAGERARVELAAALLALGMPRLRAGDVDDLAGLVPEYVTLPRGVRAPGPDEAVALSGARGGDR